MDEPEKVEPKTPCMDVYKATIQSYGILDELKVIIVVRGYLHIKDLIGDTCSLTASRRTLKYFLTDAFNKKTGLYQLDFIGALLQAKVKNRLFVEFENRYADHLQNIQVILEEP